jgi:mRNA-degrading endonuclease toxin of MazEF toxin-antitoxin module
MFKKKLTRLVGTLTADKLKELDHALRYALELAD